MSSLGSILAQVEQKVAGLLEAFVGKQEEQDEKIADLDRRVTALENASTTAAPKRGQSVAAKAQTATGKGSAT